LEVGITIKISSRDIVIVRLSLLLREVPKVIEKSANSRFSGVVLKFKQCVWIVRSRWKIIMSEI
jgi:hypothetical protein